MMKYKIIRWVVCTLPTDEFNSWVPAGDLKNYIKEKIILKKKLY